MSLYGPPGGPYNAEPQDPWQSNQPDDGYADPWAAIPAPQHDPQTGPDPQTGYGQAAGPGPARAYGAGPVHRQPELWAPLVAAPARRRTGVRIAVVVALAILLSGAAGIAVYVATRPDASPDSAGAPAPVALPSSSANGAINAVQGNCVINNGSEAAASLQEVGCAPGTFQVVKRINGTSDVKRCEGVPGYTHNFFYNTGSAESTFVLCMKLL
ncbi:MAG TPA: hypothetical protein VK453_12440 [Micromonosporaceae bacterium]|nr:hypothetical protein [Micromonosporaceae bacterium]